MDLRDHDHDPLNQFDKIHSLQVEKREERKKRREKEREMRKRSRKKRRYAT